MYLPFMIKKYKIKKALFKLLNILPTHKGFSVYYFIQNKLKRITLEEKLIAGENTYRDLKKILEQIDVKLENKSVLEIGSGWLPILPYFLRSFGKAGDIFTYDLRSHYSKKAILELNQKFEVKYKVQIQKGKNAYGLPPGISYYPNTDLTTSSIPEVDLIFSRFVLEHVSPEDLKGMHLNFKKHLKLGSHIVHYVSPSDHRAYEEKSLSLQDFLKFSEEEWNKLQTKFDYHNRWRLPQYISLFRSLGYEISYLEYDNPEKNSSAYQKFLKVPVHSDFQKFNKEELTAGSIKLILKVV